MTRVEFGRHGRVATQPDDGTSDIQPQRDWNGNAHKQQGITGFIGTSNTLASNAFVLSDALHIITGAGGNPDNLVTITSTDALTYDEVELIAASGQTITVKNGTGNILLEGGVDKVLSTTLPLKLKYDGINWREFGHFQAGITTATNTWSLKQTFSGVVEVDNQIGINIGTFVASELIHGVKDGGAAQIVLDAYGTGNYNHYIGRAARGTKASPTTLSADDIITALTGRAYDGTSFAAAGNPQIRLVAAENQSGSAHGTYISFLTTKKTTTILSEVFRLNDDGTINITNPAFTFNYILTPAAISANRILNLPLITGTDTLMSLGLAQTMLAALTFTTGLLKVADVSDSNGNKSLAITATASAVDYFTFINAATSSPATIKQQATGSDSNINMLLSPKGTGKLQFSDGADLTKLLALDLSGATGGFTTTLAFAGTAARTITFPDATDTVALLNLAQTIDAKTFTGVVRVQNAITAITPASSITLDFSTNEVQTLANGATAALTISTSNLVSGRSKTLIINNGSTAITSFPSLPSWIWVGGTPTALAANKTMVITLLSTGTTDAAVVAAYAVQS